MALSSKISNRTINAFVYIESGGNPKAKAPTSSALGPGQFLKSTWLGTVERHRPDLFNAYDKVTLLALRTDWTLALEMLARFAEDNLDAMGGQATPGDLYLAHFLGVGPARKVMRASPNTPVANLVSAEAIRANRSILQGKTAGQVRTWAQTKMESAATKAKDYVGLYYRGPYQLPEVGARRRKTDTQDDARDVQQRPGLRPTGDPQLYDHQVQLKSMHYNPGGLDGVWGGGTAGAIAAFLNDHNPTVPVPTTYQAYRQAYDFIDSEIDKAEADGFKRPVTVARREADPATVERAAPEIVPAKRNFLASVGAFFTAFGTAVYQFVSWLMGWKDQASEWGIGAYLGQVPAWVWLLLGSALLAFLVFSAIRTVRGIERPVTTGERM